MNAALVPGRARGTFAIPLRTVVAAGSWSNALVPLGMAIGPLLALTGAIPRGKAFGLGLVLAATCTMFWSMVAGGRLLGIFLQSIRLRLPHVGRQSLRCGVVALVLAVLLPALVYAGGGYALAVAALAAGAALGLLWVSIPPWTMWVLIALGVGARWLPVSIDDATWTAWFTSPASLAWAALAMLAASALCWRWLAMRGDTGSPGPWSTPLALAFAAIPAAPGAPAGLGAPALGLDTPVGSDLRREPGQALRIALGPGFGRTTLKALLLTQGPIVAVILFWLLLGTGSSGNVAREMGLKFAPLLALSTAFAPMMRLQTLYLRPALGLHELALLPGLPARAPARTLATQLLRQMLVRILPAMALLAGFGLLMRAPPAYHHMLLWTTFASAALIGSMVLLSLHSAVMRWTSIGVITVITLAMLATMAILPQSADPPGWLVPAWSLALLAGATLWNLAVARLRARPHPWLQN
jgi:hypothetical protein